jgi:hypothetical protein
MVGVGQDDVVDIDPVHSEVGQGLGDGGRAAGDAGVDDGGLPSANQRVGRDEAEVDPMPADRLRSQGGRGDGAVGSCPRVRRRRCRRRRRTNRRSR